MAAARPARFKVGVTDGSLKLASDPEAVLWASELLFDCLQVSLGRAAGEGKLPLASADLQRKYREASKQQKLPIGSLCLDVLEVDGLKTRGDPRAQRWVAAAIPIAKALGARVIRLPGSAHPLENQADGDYVGDLLKELAPAAEKAKIVLALEDTRSARDGARLLERTRSKAVRRDYDVGNAARAGFDVVEEIKWLGAERLGEVRLQENPGYLGKGKIDFPAVIDALAEIGFDQAALLATDSPSGDLEVDLTQNQNFIRQLIRARNGRATGRLKGSEPRGK